MATTELNNETAQQNSSTGLYVDLDNMDSMEALLGTDTGAEYKEGAIVTGKVAEKRDSGVIVDFRYKSEGLVPREEFPNYDELKEGDPVKAMLVELESDEGMPLLSVEQARLEEAWREFEAKHEEGGVITGTISRRVKGGLMVSFGVEAFLPGSQVDVTPVRNLDDMVGREFEFKILKVNTERRNVVVSRRELLEQEKAKQRAKLLNELLPGQLRPGIVKNITDFGAFVDLHGIDGLIHITDMSWGRISHPSEMLGIGDEVESVILDVDRDKERVSLGLKQKTPDPWETVEEKYPVGSTIHGRVVNVMPYGGFVEIEEGVEGLVHVSEMSWTKRITRASDVLSVGEEVDCVVLDIQRDAKKISLSLRQTMENPWEAAARKYPPMTKIQGQVRNMTSYGAFIEIEPDIDGMVHVSDMSWTRKINNPAEVLSKGQEVEAVVLDIDPKAQRISLGIKQLSRDPWEHIDDLFRVGDLVHGKVTKTTNFGAFVQLDHDIDGLIHISQLADERIDKVRDIVQVDDDVEAVVIKIDQQDRRIGLSLRESDRDRGYQPPATGGPNLRPGDNMVDIGDLLDSAMEGFDLEEEEDEDEE